MAEAPRQKSVVVGGREFVVRPLRGVVAREFGSIDRGNEVDTLVAMCATVLVRMAPDVTEAWLLDNGDMGEYRDVMNALRVVTHGPEAVPGEAKAPA